MQAQLHQIAASLPAGKLGLYVERIGSDETYGLHADDRFPLASVLKVPVLVEFFRQVGEEGLRPDERMELTAARKSPGSGILMELAPGLTPTLHDLATLMIIRSDNTATDMVIERLGIGNVNRTLDRLGLHQTRVTMDCRTLLYNCMGLAMPGDRIGPELAAEYERREAANRRDTGAIGYSDSLQNDVGTPRELARLLTLILKGEAFDRAAGDGALAILKRQQIRDRLPRLLPPDAVLAHKTGSIWGVRNDVGILYTPVGPVAVACLSMGCGDETEAAATAIAKVGRAVWEHFSE